MDRKFAQVIAGAVLAVGMNIATAGETPTIGTIGETPAILGAADYQVMSVQEMQDVKGTVIPELVAAVVALVPPEVAALLPPLPPDVLALINSLP